jgi:D-serine deaminase-like pyridoxal phosphate-dependent protein
VDPSNIALTVISRILSVYPDRREGLCDCGGLSVSKDQGPIGGFGDIISPQPATGWYLGGVSQEHGILRRKADRGGLAGLPAESQNAEKRGFEGLKIGDLIRLVPQHACLVCAGHPWIYVVDGGDEVVDVWVTWKGW